MKMSSGISMLMYYTSMKVHLHQTLKELYNWFSHIDVEYCGIISASKLAWKLAFYLYYHTG